MLEKNSDEHIQGRLKNLNLFKIVPINFMSMWTAKVKCSSLYNLELEYLNVFHTITEKEWGKSCYAHQNWINGVTTFR